MSVTNHLEENSHLLAFGNIDLVINLYERGVKAGLYKEAIGPIIGKECAIDNGDLSYYTKMSLIMKGWQQGLKLRNLFYKDFLFSDTKAHTEQPLKQAKIISLMLHKENPR